MSDFTDAMHADERGHGPLPPKPSLVSTYTHWHLSQWSNRSLCMYMWIRYSRSGEGTWRPREEVSLVRVLPSLFHFGVIKAELVPDS